MDRIYFSHTFVLEMMKDAAQKAGIIFRKRYNDFSHRREVVAMNPVAGLDAGDETLADLVLEVPVSQWHKSGVPYLDTFAYLMLDGGVLELRNHNNMNQIAGCQSTSGYATRYRHVCPLCNAVHESSTEIFCDECCGTVYSDTVFGRILNGRPVTYKGKTYPSSLFKRGKPILQLRRYLQIERLFNNN